MADLGLSQGAFDLRWKRYGLILAMRHYLKDVRDKFDPSHPREQLVEMNNTNGFTSNWVLTGLSLGVNTDAAGRLWVFIADETPWTDEATVSIYKNSGAGSGNLVAEGSGGNGTTVILVEQNNSGLSGTVDLGVVTISEAAALHYLVALPDFALQALRVFNGDLASDSTMRTLCEVLLRQAWAAIDQVMRLVTGDRSNDGLLRQFYVQEMGPFMEASGDTTAIQPFADVDVVNDEGVVYPVFSGFQEQLRLNMADNSTAQTVLKNVVAAATPVFDSNNQGLGAMTTPTCTESARGGLVLFEVTDPTIGKEKFSVSQRVTATGEIRSSTFPLQIKKTWGDAALGLEGVTVTRTLSLPVGSDNDFKDVPTAWSIDGESAKNTDDGDIYLQVVASGSNWIINGYKAPGRLTGDRVFTTAATAAGGTVAMQAMNSSGLSGEIKVGSSPTTTNTGTLRLNVFRKRNANGTTDKVTVVVTETSRGVIQRHVVDVIRHKLNSAASGETVPDTLVTRGTFVPYVQDDDT